MKNLVKIALLGMSVSAFAGVPTPEHYSCSSSQSDGEQVSFVFIPSHGESIHVADAIDSREWRTIKRQNLFSGTDEEGGAVHDFKLDGNLHAYIPSNMINNKRMPKGKVKLARDNGAQPNTNSYRATLVGEALCKYMPIDFNK